VLSCVVGTVAIASLGWLVDYSGLQPSSQLAYAFFPALRLVGFLELDGSKSAIALLSTALLIDAMFYGSVVLIGWRLLIYLSGKCKLRDIRL